MTCCSRRMFIVTQTLRLLHIPQPRPDADYSLPRTRSCRRIMVLEPGYRSLITEKPRGWGRRPLCDWLPFPHGAGGRIANTAGDSVLAERPSICPNRCRLLPPRREET